MATQSPYTRHRKFTIQINGPHTTFVMKTDSTSLILIEEIGVNTTGGFTSLPVTTYANSPLKAGIGIWISGENNGSKIVAAESNIYIKSNTFGSFTNVIIHVVELG